MRTREYQMDQDDALIDGHGACLPQEQPKDYSPGPYGSAAFHESQRLK